MARKKPTISDPNKKKKDYNKPKFITLVDGTKVKERYHNDYGVKRVYKKKVKDPEDSPLSKEAEEDMKMKYPPPKRGPVFRAKWKKLIKNLTDRDSFKTAHLDTLEILCDLYVEYADLEATIRKEGRTYKSVSRFGEVRKMHPAVSHLDKVRANIRSYTQRLDLFPKKDNTAGDGEDEEEWD